MRRVIIAGLVAVSWLFAAAPLTSINALITWADGSNPSGTATITWKGSLNNDRSPIFPGKTTITITSGVVSVSLYPNDVALPPAGCYTVDYVLNATKLRKYWYVPTASLITDLKQIEGDLPCPTQSGVIVSPSQVQPGTAGQTLVLTSPPNGVPRWTTSPGIVLPLVLAPPAATITPGFAVTQSGPTSGNQNQNIFYNSINITSDAANTSNSVPNYGEALDVTYNFGGTNMSGPRTAGRFNAILNSPSSPTNTANDYVAVQGVCSMNSSDNGTNTSGGAKGGCYASNFVAQSAQANLFGVFGSEADVGVQSPGSMRFRIGYNAVGAYNTTAAQLDAAFAVGATTGPWINGLMFTNVNGGAPIKTTGCAICTDGSVNTITTGLDLSSYNITGKFLKGPQGFSVDGTTAQVTSTGYVTTGSPPTSCVSDQIGGGTCTFSGGSTNSSGAMILTTAGSPGGNGTITLTLSGGGLGLNAARCSFQYTNGSGAWTTPSAFVFGTNNNTTVVAQWNNTGALTTAKTYLVGYDCIGQ